ncbi:MAG: copper transporter [Acidimicrobiales bacterium]|nr:copper transporter [Acidimicrobiales bacterium]
MINIRYHIVSITAVFLALGIGIALGSTFLDGATVDVLNRNIADAEQRIGDAKARIAELEQQAEDAEARDDALLLLGTDRLLGGSLTDQRVLLVADQGVDDRQLDALRSVLERSGADLRGTLVLRERLASGTESDDDLAAALGLVDPTPIELRDAATEALRTALADAGTPLADDEGADDATTTTVADDGEASTTTTTAVDDEEPATGDGTEPDELRALLDRGFVDLEPGPQYADDDPLLAEGGYRYVFVGSADPEPADTDLLLALLPDDADAAALPAVIVASTQRPAEDGEEVAPTIVRRLRDDDARAKRYTTVDDLETFAGLVATTFSVADLGSVEPGHYGQADGASAVLPPSP